jgi:hypothetical protein
MPPKVDHLEVGAGDAERRGPGGWFQPEAYIIDVEQGGEIMKQTPEGGRQAGLRGAAAASEPSAPGRAPSDLAPRQPAAVPLSRVVITVPEQLSPGPVGLPKGRPEGLKGRERPEALWRPEGLRPTGGRRRRLADLSGDTSHEDEACFEEVTLRTIKGIAALRSGPAAGPFESRESAAQLDAAIEAVKTNGTPARVSRTQVAAVRRRRGKASVLLLGVLGVGAALALGLWSQGLLTTAAVPPWARQGLERAAGAASMVLGR